MCFQRRSLTYMLRGNSVFSISTRLNSWRIHDMASSKFWLNATLRASRCQRAYSSAVIGSATSSSAHGSSSSLHSICLKTDSLCMQRHTTRITKRSHRASSPSPWAGSSFEAATSNFSGKCSSLLPLRNNFSFSTVSSVFCMAGPAFHISSRNTTSAVGRNPSVALSYTSSDLSLAMLTGPNISSGVENLDIKYSNDVAPPKAFFSRRATIDFATPGGPSNKMLSPANAANSARAISVFFS